MTGKTHLLSGFILGAALCAKYHLAAPYMMSCVAGTMFPDTDHSKSMLGKFIPLWLVFKPHRKNVLHSLKGMSIASLIWLCLMTSWLHAAFFAAGYVIHLMLDTLTKMGVPWLWPKRKMFSLAGVVNGIWELIVLSAFYTIVIATMSVL